MGKSWVGQPGKWTWTAVALFVAWLFFALAAYYVTQRPFDAALIQAIQRAGWGSFAFSGAALARSLADVAVTLWLTGTALGLGLWLWHWLGASDAPPLEALLFSWGMGLGALGLLVLFVGLAGWLTRPFLFSFTFILMLAGLPALLPFLRTMRAGKRPSPLVTFYLLTAVGLAFTLALLPPSDWDGLFYHLKGPKLYLAAAQIQSGIDIPHLNFPSLFEMLFMLAMALRSDVTAVLLHFTCVFLLSGLVYAIARYIQPGQGWTAVLFLFSMPMLLKLGSWAYNDLALAFYQIGALYALLRWQQAQQRQWLILSGLFCGLAMGLKYTSFVSPLVLAALIARESRPYRARQTWTQLVQHLLLFALPALLVALPWYVKNFVFTGNPTYPFVFNGRFWDDFRTTAYSSSGSGLGFDPIALLRLPYDLTLGIRDASQDGQMGPLFLAMLPLLLIHIPRMPKALHLILWFVLAQYAFWAIGVIFSAGLWQSRLLLPAFVALCPALAWLLQAIQPLDYPQFSLQRFLNLVIGFVLALGLLQQAQDWLARAPLTYVIGSQNKAERLTQALGVHYQVMQQLNQTLPPNAVVLFLWEPRSYYCDLDCRPDSILDKYSHLEHLHRSAASIAAALAAEGVTHLLIFDQGLTFLRDNEMRWVVPANDVEYERFLATHTRLVQQWGERYSLRELLP